MEPKKEKKKGYNWKKGTSIQLTKQEPSGFKKLSNYKTPKKATEYNRQNENQVGSKKFLNYRALQIHWEDLQGLTLKFRNKVSLLMSKPPVLYKENL
jgi:hypothetical protein